MMLVIPKRNMKIKIILMGENLTLPLKNKKQKETKKRKEKKRKENLHQKHWNQEKERVSPASQLASLPPHPQETAHRTPQHKYQKRKKKERRKKKEEKRKKKKEKRKKKNLFSNCVSVWNLHLITRFGNHWRQKAFIGVLIERWKGQAQEIKIQNKSLGKKKKEKKPSAARVHKPPANHFQCQTNQDWEMGFLSQDYIPASNTPLISKSILENPASDSCSRFKSQAFVIDPIVHQSSTTWLGILVYPTKFYITDDRWEKMLDEDAP